MPQTSLHKFNTCLEQTHKAQRQTTPQTHNTHLIMHGEDGHPDVAPVLRSSKRDTTTTSHKSSPTLMPKKRRCQAASGSLAHHTCISCRCCVMKCAMVSSLCVKANLWRGVTSEYWPLDIECGSVCGVLLVTTSSEG